MHGHWFLLQLKKWFFFSILIKTTFELRCLHHNKNIQFTKMSGLKWFLMILKLLMADISYKRSRPYNFANKVFFVGAIISKSILTVWSKYFHLCSLFLKWLVNYFIRNILPVFANWNVMAAFTNSANTLSEISYGLDTKKKNQKKSYWIYFFKNWGHLMSYS